MRVHVIELIEFMVKYATLFIDRVTHLQMLHAKVIFLFNKKWEGVWETKED